MCFSFLANVNHPHQPAQFPHHHLAFHAPPFRPITTHQLHNGPHHREVGLGLNIPHLSYKYEILYDAGGEVCDVGVGEGEAGVEESFLNVFGHFAVHVDFDEEGF
jgi:hypothetical protein